MEKIVDSLMTDEMLSEFLDLYGLDHDTKKQGDFENYVFEVYKEGQPYILRLTHNSHRNKDEIESELDWMLHLLNSGLSVPKAYHSKNGNYVEEIRAADHSVFLGCMYSKAEGASVDVRSDQFNHPLFRIWGETIGLMHQATKSYNPSKGIIKRVHWYEDELLDVEKHYPPGDPELVQNAKEVIQRLHELPIGQDCYGLIHTDLHSGNFFYDGEQIHVFDFDDASYHWFGSDIAIPLYYSIFYRVPASQQAERQKFGDQFLAAFMEGYEKANRLPHGWKDQIKLFLMLRDVVLYAVLHKKISPDDRGERVIAMIDEIKKRIKNKSPIITV